MKLPQIFNKSKNDKLSADTSAQNAAGSRPGNTKNKPHKKSGVSNASKGGFYSFFVTIIVLAILVMVNVFASAIPSTYTSYDISAAQLYSVTGNTRVVISALEDDVTIYWIVQNDEENQVIENLLQRYSDLSDHISVVKRNPDEYPTFAKQYTDETVENNSLVVECGEKNRYIAYSDIYKTEANYTTGEYESTFDGEGQITSAIDYVTREEVPIIYTLEGHGEQDLPTELSDQITKANYEVESFSLLTEDGVPEDAACVIIYAPESDISKEEKDLLKDYADGGGKLFVAAGPTEEGILENLYGLLSDYGVEAAEGVVAEEDPMHYGFQVPYILLPDMQSTDITDPLIDENYYVLVPMAAGLTVSDTVTNVTSFLDTSDTAYSKADGFTATNFDKQEGDTDGPFSVGVTITCDNDGEIIWISSSYYLSELYNEYSSGANTDLTMNALTSLIGETDTMSIRTRSLNYNLLTLSAAQSNMLRLLIVVVIPLVFVVLGAAIVVRRRSLKK